MKQPAKYWRTLAFAMIAVAVAGITPAWGACLMTGQDLGVDARAALVMEASTGLVLFAQNSDQELPMASTTKIMTALLALEHPQLDVPFVVEESDIRAEGSSMGLLGGDTVTLRNLAGGMLMASGNDAAQAAAVFIAGGLPEFAQLMNQRAAELGMEHTQFVTPSGLDDPEHYSTAYDMALLGRAALQNPLFAEMCGSSRLRLNYGNPPYDRSLRNHNRLVREFPGTVGIKTGFTKRSGRCLVSAVERGGITLICVTLGCGDDWNVHKGLYQRYFDRLTLAPLPDPGPLVIPVTGGSLQRVRVAPEQLPMLPQGEGWPGEITTRIYAPQFLYAPQIKGDIAGKIVYYRGNCKVGESPLLIQQDIPQAPQGRSGKQ